MSFKKQGFLTFCTTPSHPSCYGHYLIFFSAKRGYALLSMTHMCIRKVPVRSADVVVSTFVLYVYFLFYFLSYISRHSFILLNCCLCVVVDDFTMTFISIEVSLTITTTYINYITFK